MKKPGFLYMFAFVTMLITIFIAADKLIKQLRYKRKTLSSIDVIGFSDGPTAIYFTSSNPLVLKLLQLIACIYRPFASVLRRFSVK